MGEHKAFKRLHDHRSGRLVCSPVVTGFLGMGTGMMVETLKQAGT